MLEFFQKLFATDFIPHGHCYFWRPEITWLNITSDGLTALAYFIIPLGLVRLARKREDLAFHWMFVLFGVFILACGATHAMAIWTLWHPVYRLDGLIKAITALASVPTAFLLIRLVPRAIALPSPEQLRRSNRALEREVGERKAAEERVTLFNADLERRVADRTRELENANKQLRERTAELEALLNYAPIGFAFFDREHRYLRVNKDLCEIDGLTKEAHLGRPISSVLPVNALRLAPLIDQVFTTGKPVESEVTGETPKEPGVTRHWLTGHYPIHADDQSVSEVGSFVIEISERKRAESAALLLSAIVDSSDDAIISKGLDGIITSWNKGAGLLFGYTAAEAVGQPIIILIPQDRLEEETSILDRLRRGEGISHLETRRRRKDGKLIEVSLTISPVVDAQGKIIGASHIARDITERLRHQEDLRAANKELRTANEDLSQFAYAASHDLREPLRNVGAYSELLVKMCDSSDETITRIKTTITDSVRRMDSLLTDLLEYTQLSAKDADDGTVTNTRDAVENAIRNLHTAIESAGAEVSCGDLPVVRGYEQHYVQLFQNLIGNALKYRGVEPAKVAISAGQQGGEYLFSVRDNGLGIGPEYHEKIFGVFKRLHGKDIPGTALASPSARGLWNATVAEYGSSLSWDGVRSFFLQFQSLFRLQTRDETWHSRRRRQCRPYVSPEKVLQLAGR